MDIQVASNFERYLYYLLDQNTENVAAKMADFSERKVMEFSAVQMAKVHEEFTASFADDEETVKTIRSFHEETGYILDPHTAVGVAVGRRVRNPEYPLVCLATAHPAKFGDAVHEAIGSDPAMPPAFNDLTAREKKVTQISAETEKSRPTWHNMQSSFRQENTLFRNLGVNLHT